MTRIVQAMDRLIPQQKDAAASSSFHEPVSSSTASSFDPASYTQPFIEFMSNNPTIYHTVSHFSNQLDKHGFTKLSERDLWSDKLEAGGKYYFTRNGSGLIAFAVGKDYKAGNGVTMIASHIDSLTAKVKPISTKPTKQGFQQLGVAQYAGALNTTWLDRDLGIGGKVFVKGSNGKVETKLVKLDWPIARIPTIAPHFGIPAEGQTNRETRMVPVIGLDNSDLDGEVAVANSGVPGQPSSFAAAHPPRLVKTIASALSVSSTESIQGWELELFDFQAAQLGGLGKELLFAGRLDDKMCGYAAIEALLASTNSSKNSGSTINLVGLFDAEEVGSLLRQGARSNFLPSTIERIVDAFSGDKPTTSLLYQTYANSFLVSADVSHAFNPNYEDVYLKDHAPRLNVGVGVYCDSNAHMTTDGASAAIFNSIAQKSGSHLQVFQIRNDSRSGGTVGPMLSSAMGVRAIDAGIPQLSMHSIRATTGSLDPGLGVKCFKGVFDYFEEVDKEFVKE
ncbi:hypothetical protein MMC10_000974 [Thelotrema lepadinum]|nr:hypothetical protein [Thelotrema lepadinum]